jgi:Putative auto-transporter adhesin, head GIN domain
MKHILTVLTILIASVAIAQNTIEKTIGEFTQLKAYDLIEVNLVKSKENKVVISGKNINAVVIVNKNGKLKIRMNLEESFDGKNTSVTLYYTNVDILDANEGAIISSEEKIKQYEIDLRAQEGGIIRIDLKVKIANIRAVTGGIIETHGTANSQDVSLNTGGIYKGKDLQTESTTVIIKAAGDAHVNASDIVDVKIRAGGDVFVYGNPKTIKENRVFGGRVKRM